MPLVFAENFQNDTLSTLQQRYPGSEQRTLTTTIPNSWPLFQGPDANIAGQNTLKLPIAVDFSERLELAFSLEFDGSTTGTTANFSLFLLGGIEVVPTTLTGYTVAIRINNNSNYLYPLKGGIAYRTSVGFSQNWNILYEKSDGLLRVVVDNQLVLHQRLPVEPNWDASIRVSSSTANGQPSTFNNVMTSLAVALDNPAGTRMTNVDFTTLELTNTVNEGWVASEGTIVSATDKTDPTLTDPNINTDQDDASLSFSAAGEGGLVNIYTAGSSDTVAGISIDGTLRILASEQTALPAKSALGSSGFTIVKSIYESVGIGVAGLAGFGVGVCPDEGWLTELNLTPMEGYDNPTHENYGNYQHTNGGISVFIPKFYYRIGSPLAANYSKYGLNTFEVVDASIFADTTEANAAGFALHRAFIDDGKEKPGFFYDKYLSSKDGTTSCKSVKNGAPISLASSAGYTVSAGMTGCDGRLYDAVVLSRARGYGWNTISIFMADAIAKIAMAHGQAATSTDFCAWYDATDTTNFPKGCNNNARADFNDPTVTFVSAGEANANKPLTGSASDLAKTTHNGQLNGITDVNGALSQATIGLTQAGTSATSTPAVTTGQCYVLKPTSKLADLTGGWNGATDVWGNTGGLANNFDAINNFMPWGSTTGWINFGNGNNQVFSGSLSGADHLRSCSGIQMATSSMSAAGTPLFGNDGCYQYGRQNLVPVVAGGWNLSGRAGVFCRYWNNYRSIASTTFGFRAAAYGS